ncbi:uncharacterized protein isoform X2 [Choristoneura fumiferana]|uniref:uncharacterized protein isoform X2 n=1 Tax=Choristoneura fumiferana TaxID=7141 RepID=UPI003D15DBF8
MSSESVTTGSSRLRQFGLYRTIDSRTEEFLKLSRRRQIRQGCACAAVSTVITVTIVVVILLIYEYGIAVESNLVQRMLYSYGNDSSINGTEDSPIADRLHRSYFGFDQDYYERMPLLVNAMQENHYIDPILEMTFPAKRARVLKNKTTTTTVNYKASSIRRTSPRPFIFEYRSPTPTPFSRTFGSKSWVESYRNAQRLQNLQQVIQYLEKTINAKFGDLYAMPSNTHIAFSGIYVPPSANINTQQARPTSPTLDLLQQSSNKVETKTNHLSDPLFSFKPDSPGDINLLADGFRFAPTQKVITESITSTAPMFRPISYRKKHKNDDKNVVDLLQGASDIKHVESSTVDKPNSFSVMLNYIPLKTTINTDYKQDDGTSFTTNKVYFTTSRPVRVHFKRKSNGPVRRMFPVRPLRKPKTNRNGSLKDIIRKSEMNKETTMIVHVNLYPQKTEVKDVSNVTENNKDYSTTTETMKGQQLTTAPELSLAQVEDYHIGSSGIIPIESRTESSQSPRVPVGEFFEPTSASTEVNNWPTNPPDMVKFSPEDARIPDQYKQLREMETNESDPFGVNRRNFGSDMITHTDVEPSTLIVKLKNEIRSTTAGTISEEIIEEESDENTTVQTYVPQINGHYRSINQNSKLLNNLLDVKNENDRKKRLELSVTRLQKASYVEMKRNNTYISAENYSDFDE